MPTKTSFLPTPVIYSAQSDTVFFLQLISALSVFLSGQLASQNRNNLSDIYLAVSGKKEFRNDS